MCYCKPHRRKHRCNIDRQTEIEDLSRRLDINTADQLVREIENAVGNLRTNANLRLSAEVLLLGMPYI